MEIYVFDKDMNRLGLIDGYLSFRWIRKYSHSGEFELMAPINPTNTTLLQEGNRIFKSDDTEIGIIGYNKMDLDKDYQEIIVVKGLFATGLLNRRIIYNTADISDTHESVIRQLITDNVIAPVNTNRILAEFDLGAALGTLESLEYQPSAKNLLNEIEQLAADAGLGIRTDVSFALNKLIFNLYQGLDRSTNQNVNSRAIFSKEFENVNSQTYITSKLDYRNNALIVASDRIIELNPELTGLERREMLVDASGLAKGTLTDEQFIALLLDNARIKIAQYPVVETFDSVINAESNLIYKTDYDVGDIVTCMSKSWGLTVHPRIEEIEEVYDSNGKTLYATFGKGLPTIMDVVRRNEM